MNFEDVETTHVIFIQLRQLIKGHVWVLFALVLKDHVANILEICHTKLVLRAFFGVFQRTICF